MTAVEALASNEIAMRRYEHDRGRLQFGANAHPELEIAWIERGAARYRIGATELEPAVGTAFVVPPGVEHATAFLPGMTARSIWVSAHVVNGVADALGIALGREAHVLRDAQPIIDLARAIRRELQQPAIGQLLMIDALTEAVVIAALRELPRRTGANCNRDPRIARAVELVHERYADQLTIDDLARAAAMSRFHFSRMFRAQLGVSPYRYLQHVRIDRARELLRSERRSVTEVALSVGFTDLGRFASMFRARVGELPSKIR